jgi:hypothetical protein
MNTLFAMLTIVCLLLAVPQVSAVSAATELLVLGLGIEYQSAKMTFILLQRKISRIGNDGNKQKL